MLNVLVGLCATNCVVLILLHLPLASQPFDSLESGVNTRVESRYVQCDRDFEAIIGRSLVLGIINKSKGLSRVEALLMVYLVANFPRIGSSLR